MPEQEENQIGKSDGPRFPWRDLGKWLAHWLARLWKGVRLVWQRLKAIPPHRRNTYLAMAGMVALLLIAGTILGFIVGSPGLGMLFVTAITSVWLAVIYFKGNSILPLLSGARPVDQGAYPELVNMLRDLSQIAALPTPSLWIAENPDVNAFACGRDPEHAALVVFTGGLSIWKGEEVRGIFAHEVAHIKNRDVLLDTFMRAIMSGMEWSFRLFRKPFEWVVRACVDMTQDRTDSWLDTGVAIFGLAVAWFLQALDFVFGVLLLPATHLVQRAASRQQEYYADSTGAEIAGSHEGLVSALQKLQVIEEPLPAMALVRGRGVHGFFEKLQSTHPPTAERIRRLGGQAAMITSSERSTMLYKRALLLTEEDRNNDRIAERLILLQKALDIGLSAEQAVVANSHSAVCYLLAQREELAVHASDTALSKDATEAVGYFLERGNREPFFPLMATAYLRMSKAVCESQGKESAITFLEERLEKLRYIPGQHMPRIHLEIAALYEALQKSELAGPARERAKVAETLGSADERAVRSGERQSTTDMYHIPERSSEEAMVGDVSRLSRGVSDHVRTQGGRMEYRVVPVDVSVLEQEGVRAVASRVETLINKEAAQGWQFLGIENIEITVTDPGGKGCFGLGAKPEKNRVVRFDMAVFRK